MGIERQDSQKYYERNNVLFKPMNVILRNAKRLAITSPRDTIDELLKNTFEHGNNFIKITMENGKDPFIKIYNGMDKKELESLTFQSILDNLTTFQKISNKNFHEGLTTLLLFKAEIHAKNYYVRNKKSSDGYFQYIERASHIIQENGREKEIQKTYNNNGWEVKLLDPPSKLFNMVRKGLHDFYFVPNHPYQIQMGGEYYKPQIIKNLGDFKRVKLQGWLFFNLFSEPSGEAAISLFWRLNNGLVFQKLRNTQFNQRQVSGKIILTNVHQFANENRHEVSEMVHRFIEEKIEEINGEIGADQKYLRALENFPQYRRQYLGFLGDFFSESASLNLGSNHIFDSSKKEESLLNVSRFLYTLKKMEEINKDMEIILPELFSHPNEPLTPLQKKEFWRLIKKMDISFSEFRSRFGGLPLAIKIVAGDPEGFLYCEEFDQFMYGQRIIQILDPHLGFSKIAEFDNKVPILYPIHPFLDYFIGDTKSHYIKHPSQFRSYPRFSKSVFPQLKDFAVNYNAGRKYLERKDTKMKRANIQDFHIDDATKISKMKVHSVHINQVEYELSVFQFSHNDFFVKIPLFFNKNKRDEVNKMIHNSRFITRSLLKKFQIFQIGTRLLIENFKDFPSKTIYPVLLYNPDGKRASYLRNAGILLYNIEKFPEDTDPIATIFFILDIISHELAHELTPTHGRKHEEIMQKLLRISKGKDNNSQIPIYKIIKNMITKT